jgi:demethylmenaquinone methyltransferase/2-methoxy-6-polyprenyl-1,4-benzoquinol methylase
MARMNLQTRAAREELVDGFFAGTGRSYDRVVKVTTFGLDARWKRQVLAHVPENAGAILDLACGTGIVTRKLHEAHPHARIVGVDVTDEYLAVAREKFAGVDADITFILSNAETMELEGTFDAVVSCYIPKYVDPRVLLSRLEGHLNPGAVVALQDFDYPRGAIPRAVWSAHMWVLSTLGRAVFPEWSVVFDRNLARLLRESGWVRRYRAAFAAHGYEDVLHEKLTFRSAGIVSARWPG